MIIIAVFVCISGIKEEIKVMDISSSSLSVALKIGQFGSRTPHFPFSHPTSKVNEGTGITMCQYFKRNMFT